MRQLTRRQLLALGAVGAGATAAGGAGLWLTTGTGSGSGYAGGEDLAEPQVLASRGGVLELDLTAAPARVRVGGREASVQAFNGSLPGPTLRVHAGDTIRITMRNGLQAPTNLHVHGLHVSPQGNSDNPFVSIDPGGSFDYEFSLPGDHPPGTYWYHPHRHGHVADQVAAGLYGAIVVEDPDPVPVTRDRVLVVSDLSLDADGNLAEVNQMQQMMGREGQIVLVNGQVRPQLRAAPENGSGGGSSTPAPPGTCAWHWRARGSGCSAGTSDACRSPRTSPKWFSPLATALSCSWKPERDPPPSPRPLWTAAA